MRQGKALEGGCACGGIRYRATRDPMIVHGCHCRWCQRETGSALAINALIESDALTVLKGTPALSTIPSQSGKGQTLARCPDCGVTLWSHYAGLGRVLAFLRVGTLDDPDAFPPDIHIYTASKQPWLILPEDRPAFAEYYRRSAVWPPASVARYDALKARTATPPK
jgi:hypothetical protein